VIPHDAGLPDPSHQVPPSQPREPVPIAGRIEGVPVARPALPPPGPAAPALSAAPDFFTLLAALRRRWISAVLLGGTLAAIAAVSVWFLLQPKHTAFAKLQVSSTPLSIIDNSNPSLSDFRTYMQTAANIITSRTVILNALKTDEVRRLSLESSEVDPVQMIEDDIKAEFKENSEILMLTFSHRDPAVAKTITQAVKNTYLTDVVDFERQRRARRVAELEKVYGEKTEALKTKKENLKTVSKNLGHTDPAMWHMQHNEIVNDLKQQRQQQLQVALKLDDTREMLTIHESRMKRMAGAEDKDKDKAGKPLDPKQLAEDLMEDALDRDGEAQQIRKDIAILERQLDRLRSSGFREDYVSIVFLKKDLDLANKQMEKRKAKLVARIKRLKFSPGMAGPGLSLDDPAIIRDQLKKRIATLTAMDEALRAEIKELAVKAAKNPTWAAEADALAEDIKGEEKIVDRIRATLDRERVELQAASRITSQQDADMMKKDIKKQVMATAVAPLAVFFGVCMGLALLEYRQRRVRTAAEISRGLGIRVVGAVPRVPHLERHLVGPAGESDLEGTPVMESIDAIRTRLLHEANTRATRVVMVTSATAGEGKTTLAAHLASSLARAGRRTLLVDGDLRRPGVHELFEMPVQPGFSEVLLGEVEVAEAAVETSLENLSVLPAGQWDREVLLALSRDGLEGVFERLADEFDFLVIDSHPVLSATDSLLMGRQTDAVILSVLREVSQMPRVFAAQQQLTGLGIRVLGAVVNAVDPEEVFTAPAATAAVA
jgi:capsular exopolysaccharide synthesis family protein